jgi:hypothetical protein
MAGREVNCEYCRVVVFEVDRWCVGCGAPRKAFPHEEEIRYAQPSVSPTYGNQWMTVCSTSAVMGGVAVSSEDGGMWSVPYVTMSTGSYSRGGEMST